MLLIMLYLRCSTGGNRNQSFRWLREAAPGKGVKAGMEAGSTQIQLAMLREKKDLRQATRRSMRTPWMRGSLATSHGSNRHGAVRAHQASAVAE